MSLGIASETGRLKTVMIHLPGQEIERMLPSMMEELLFDDILFGNRAREEHRRFRRLIEIVADEVLEFRDFLAEVMHDDGARAAALKDLSDKLELPAEVMEILGADGPDELATHLIEGILRPGVTSVPEEPRSLYLLPPVPNLFFQRDPAIVIGNRVAIANMATSARLREPLLASYVYANHPRFAIAGASPVVFQQYGSDTQRHSLANPRPSLEGGDVLVPREDILLVGLSIRTSWQTIEGLAKALRDAGSKIRHVILVDIPKARTFMHLDTIFTVIDRGECLIYPPAILPGGAEEVDVFQVDLDAKELAFTPKDSLLDALSALGMDLKPIHCGGDDPIAQQREQWTDGANAFALGPGIILLYERNVKTAEALSKAGYEVVYEDDLLLGRSELELRRPKKYAILMEGHELSRARGGPRCMTCPLEREG